MKKLTAILIVLFLTTFGINQTLNAQDQDSTVVKKHIVYLNDGTQYIGQILSDDGREVLMLTQSIGKIYLNKSDIKSMTLAEDNQLEEYKGEFRTKSPFNTRYFFTTNGHPLKKGENYAMIHLYGPEIHFAVTDRFSLGIMTTWIGSPFVAAAKYAIPTKNENLNFSLGALAGSSGYLNNFRGYGALGFGTVTFGGREKNISISAGFARLNTGEDSNSHLVPGVYDVENPSWSNYPDIPSERRSIQDITAPALSLAGMIPMGKKATFIFDSMIFFTSQEVTETETVETTNEWGYVSSVEVIGGLTTKKNIAMYLMPGVRVQEAANRAIQISLAGLTRFDDGEVDTFPLPMVTWFFNF